MTAEQLIDALQAQNLLPESTIEKLRKKIGASSKPLSAKSLARYLIDKDLITKKQALALLVEGGEVSKASVGPRESSDAGNDLGDAGGLASPLDELQDLSSSAEWGIDDSSSFGAGAGQALEAEAKTSSKKSRKKAKKANDWDSPLLLIGGGTVVTFLLIGAVIIYILFSEDTDKILAEARAAMEGSNYATAVENYERFLEKGAGHPERSKARMELAMTRIRQALSLSPQRALETAKAELDATANEGDFRQAEEHLSDLLPTIANQLAERADTSDDPQESQQYFAQAKEALGMAYNTKYIPKARRDVTELEGIRETIDRVERRQQALVDLDAAIEKIEAALASGDAGTAFSQYEQLVDKHPSLIGNKRIAEALAKTAEAEQANITYQAEVVEATTADRDSPVKAALGMVSVRQAGQAPVAGMYYVQVAGVLYGVNAADGEVVWRRYVGVMTEPNYPQPVDSDLVLLEWMGSEGDQQQELVRMEGATGEVKWRLPLDEVCAEPLVHGGRVYLSGDSGKLRVIDAESGRQEGYLKFSQPLKSSPAVNSEKNVLYVAGEHSSLYSIDLNENKCIGVFYSRHGRNAVVAAPAVVLDKVIFVENDGAQTCKLRTFVVDGQGALDKPIQERRLDGRVVRQPLVSGRRLVVLTDRGQISVYEIAMGSEGEPVSNLANRSAPPGASPFLRFAALGEGNIWYGENSLAKFVVAPAGNRLTIQDLAEDFNRSQFVAPIEVREGVVLHTRSRRGHAGFTITASSVENGKPYWEVDVAAPPAGDPVSAGSRGVLRSDANGQTHLFEPSQAGVQFVRLELDPQNPQSEDQTYEYSTPLASGGAIYSSPGDSAVVWQQASGEARVLRLPGKLACEPAAFGEGWLAPLELGQVFYISGSTGTPLAAPFQPPLSAGGTVSWLSPAAIDEEQFVVSDGSEKIYSVELDPTGIPALRAMAVGEVGDVPLVTRLARAGEYIYAATRDGRCMVYHVTTLERQEPVDLGGPVMWGPYAVGPLVLLHTAGGQLVAFDGSGQKVWEQPFEQGQIAGAPVIQDDGCLLATDTGSIVAVGLQEGSISATAKVEEPLMGGPALMLGRLVVAATDGTLLVVESPAGSGGQR